MKKNTKFSKININKTSSTVFAISLIQIIMLIAIAAYDSLHGNNIADMPYGIGVKVLVYAVAFAVIINSYITIRYVYSIARETEQHGMVEETLNQLENLNKTLREQRHDFMNHLQVVYGLMEMEEYKEAQGYIDKIYSDIQSVNKFLKTSNPAVNALLQAKVIFAEKRDIIVRLNITTRLEELKIQSWEFCRVLGNIIDNSIYALQEVSGNKIIDIELFEDIKEYGFKIKNNGPEIPEEIRSKIFESGFTTKGEKGDGMGLAIAKEILSGAGGTLRVQSNESETRFEGSVPR